MAPTQKVAYDDFYDDEYDEEGEQELAPEDQGNYPSDQGSFL